MALIWADRVLETSTTTGTGNITLAAAVTGYQRFSAVCTSPSDTAYYAIEAVDSSNIPTGDWETGLGTYSASNTLTRTTVLASSNSGSAVSFAAGTKRVMLTTTASGGPAILTTSSALCSGDLSTTTSYQDVAGVTLTLAAGTWLLVASATATGGGVNTLTVKLYNQSDSVDLVAGGASLGGAGYYEMIPLSYVITLSGSKTIRMAAVVNNSSGWIIKRYGDGAAPSPASIPGTYLHAVKIS